MGPATAPGDAGEASGGEKPGGGLPALGVGHPPFWFWGWNQTNHFPFTLQADGCGILNFNGAGDPLSYWLRKRLLLWGRRQRSVSHTRVTTWTPWPWIHG